MALIFESQSSNLIFSYSLPVLIFERTEFDSPEVDGEVLISKEIQLKKGQFYQIEITDSEEFDLYGKVV
jgi:tRNA A37 methylthiotransferase MiaB